MVNCNESNCPNCSGELKYYGKVRRIVRTKCGKVRWIEIRRLCCISCGSMHRELPDYLLPHKHYEFEIINGVISGMITPYDLEYEDYPCEMTVKRWINEFKSLKA